MESSLPETVSEADAVIAFRRDVIDTCAASFQAFVNVLSPHIEATLAANPDFFSRPATQATFVAAVLALEVQAVRTKFPPDQANRLRDEILEAFEEIDTANLTERYERLDKTFRDAVDSGQNAFEAYGAGVFRELQLEEYLSLGSGHRSTPNPVHTLLLTQISMSVVRGWWKRFMAHRVLVP